MNLIAPLLTAERIRIDLDASAKGRMFDEIGRAFAAHNGPDATLVAESLASREKLGSTAIGQGVALPHARVKGLHQPLAAYLRLLLPMSFDAPDGKPVSDFLVLLVPEQATEAHLQMLAEAAQMFSDRRFRDRLRNQNDAAGVYSAFAHWPAVAV
jgi:PTS system nitrogen regulatory IIA component